MLTIESSSHNIARRPNNYVFVELIAVFRYENSDVDSSWKYRTIYSTQALDFTFAQSGL